MATKTTTQLEADIASALAGGDAKTPKACEPCWSTTPSWPRWRPTKYAPSGRGAASFADSTRRSACQRGAAHEQGRAYRPTPVNPIPHPRGQGCASADSRAWHDVNQSR